MYSHCGTLKFNYQYFLFLPLMVIIHLLQRHKKATIYSGTDSQDSWKFIPKCFIQTA